MKWAEALIPKREMKLGRKLLLAHQGQSESRDPLDFVHPTEILISNPSSEIEVLEEAVPPEDTSGLVPPAEEPTVATPHSES